MIDLESLPPVLFHGTDGKIFGFSKEGREKYFASCRKVLDTLWPFYSEKMAALPDMLESVYHDKSENERELRIQRVMEDVETLSKINCGDSTYEYGDLYLHSSLYLAWGCALSSNAGGELATTAWSLILAAEDLGFDFSSLDEDTLSDVESIKEFGNDIVAPALLIFPTNELDLENLKDFGGDEATSESRQFRYLKEIDLYHWPHCVQLPPMKDFNPMGYSDNKLMQILAHLIKQQQKESD